MSQSSIDYQSLAQQLAAPKVYKLNEVQNKITKIAFDVVRFKDGENIDGLWQIQQDSDGSYIVAMYEETPEVKTSSDWSVVANQVGTTLSFFYKETPITRLAFHQLGLSNSDSELVTSYLPIKLAHNPALVKGLLQELSIIERQELFKKHPELNQ